MDNGKHSGNSKATNRGDPGADMTSLIVVISFYCYKNMSRLANIYISAMTYDYISVSFLYVLDMTQCLDGFVPSLSVRRVI